MLQAQSNIPFMKFGTMPVDFTSYLLSSSPPASSFELLNFSPHLESNNRLSINGYIYKENSINSSTCSRKQKRADLNQKKNRPDLKPIITKINSVNEEEGLSHSCSSSDLSPTPPTSPGRSKKKVSFADHRGMALARVKIMTEPSDVPPRLNAEVLEAVRQGATASVSDQPPLIIDFLQPASDYMLFRGNLERNFISLENVIIRDYKVLGTIKVKNVSFEKNVFVRVSFDCWENSQDVESIYVAGQMPSSHDSDTFSFEFDVATNLDRSAVIEFAVCYEANGQQYWDNKAGENYKIKISSELGHTSPPAEEKPSDTLGKVDSWTEYAAWNKVDTSIPYW